MPKRDPDTPPKYAIHVAGKTQALGYLPAASEADAIQHYCEINPLALGFKDMLRAVLVSRRG